MNHCILNWFGTHTHTSLYTFSGFNFKWFHSMSMCFLFSFFFNICMWNCLQINCIISKNLKSTHFFLATAFCFVRLTQWNLFIIAQSKYNAAREYQKHEMNRHTKKNNLLLYFAVPFFDFHHVISVVPIWISAGNLHEHNHSAISGSRCRLLFFPYVHIHLRNNEIIFNRKRIARVHFHSTAVIKAPYRSQSMENMNSSSVAINSIRFCYLTDSIVINKSEIIYAIFARNGSALNECRGNQMTKWKSRPKLTLPLGRY